MRHYITWFRNDVKSEMNIIQYFLISHRIEIRAWRAFIDGRCGACPGIRNGGPPEDRVLPISYSRPPAAFSVQGAPCAFFVIKIGKPPALPGDLKSLTIPGVFINCKVRF
jgi:hypothetical protein